MSELGEDVQFAPEAIPGLLLELGDAAVSLAKSDIGYRLETEGQKQVREELSAELVCKSRTIIRVLDAVAPRADGKSWRKFVSGGDNHNGVTAASPQ